MFIPTTPNPTSGLMIYVPRAELTTLSIDVADATKLIISSGAVHPGGDVGGADSPTLLDKLESWLAHDGKHAHGKEEKAHGGN